MFDWKKRLQAVRRELVVIAEECETAPAAAAAAAAASGVSRVARILVRVIDSLPG